MIKSVAIKRIIFFAFAILSIMAAIYHLIGIFYKINDSPIWRHSLFVIINLFCVFGFIKRPRYFIYIYVVLIIQQYYSHGQHLIKLWDLEHKIHWISLFVLILLPIGLICLLTDYKTNRIENYKKETKNTMD
jgi:hypothetical protein